MLCVVLEKVILYEFLVKYLVVAGVDEVTRNVQLYRNTSQSIDADELAAKFSEWFYGLLNSSVSGELQTGLGAEHFWPNCNLALKLESPEGNLEQSVRENSDEAVHLLCTTCVGHRLLFNPNLTRDGVKGRMDSHGLVTVIACGTLHVGSMCVGVFEQAFGLIRDPSAHNNWKIKTTELQMKAMSVTSLPTVQAGTLNSELSLTKF
ncbi:uncharacterized protein C3orf38 isoform X2 [Bacillus rossius redtenbacheri]|uniref:uncharacterized protein C3orf38 isoform X2 n=1 Tax=Bacillus rossius redtenbacheri TaxID=93214 RepID=UPI002FDC96AC